MSSYRQLLCCLIWPQSAYYIFCYRVASPVPEWKFGCHLVQLFLPAICYCSTACSQTAIAVCQHFCMVETQILAPVLTVTWVMRWMCHYILRIGYVNVCSTWDQDVSGLVARWDHCHGQHRCLLCPGELLDECYIVSCDTDSINV